MSAPNPAPRNRLSSHFAWNGRLAHYARHLNGEHREALFAEAMRFAGLQLEGSLATSAYWSEAPLARRAAVLLYLVDRGVVDRRYAEGRPHFVANPGAEARVAVQPSLAPYLVPTLELLAALRDVEGRRLLAADGI